MRPKPPGLGPEYAAQFGDPSVVAAYAHRAPYPPAVFARLAELAGAAPAAVLDVGCGRGEIARPLAPLVARVDAVDVSPGMIAAGQALPGGAHPHLHWICAPAEAAPLDPPYALVTAGSSLHWMAWDVVIPRFARVLAPGGLLALVGTEAAPAPWDAGLAALIPRYSTNRDYTPYDLVAELESRGLFHPLGDDPIPALPFHQPVAAFVEAIHSMNGLSRDRLAPAATAAFDAAVRVLVAPYAADDVLTLEIGARVVWGPPVAKPGEAAR